MCINNGYRRGDSYDVGQLDDVAGSHSDASITGRRTDFPFLWRTVDVDIAGKRIDVLRFSPTQPKNARDDRIAARGSWQHDFRSEERRVGKECRYRWPTYH